MKIPIRYFSIGLFTAAIIMLSFYLFTDDKSHTVKDLSLDELTEQIEEKGYRVISNDDYISFSVYLDEQREKENGTNKDNETIDNDNNRDSEDAQDREAEDEAADDATENEPETESEAKEITFTVEQGSVSQNIAEILQQNDIINDPQAFIQFLEDNNYSPRIQIGTFTVNSEMSLREIAEVITTFPGN